MVFEPSQEQQDFQKTVRRFFEKECDSAFVRGYIQGEDNAALALLGRSFDTLGLGAVFGDAGSACESLPELIIFASEYGRALCPQFFLEGLVAGPLLFSSFVSLQSQQNLDAQFGPGVSIELCLGQLKAVRAPLFYQSQSELTLSNGDMGLLSTGTLRLVPSLQRCDFLIYQQGDIFYIISLIDSQKIVRETEYALDLTQAREKIMFQEAPACELTVKNRELFQAISFCLISAEICGVCRKVVEMTAEHLKTRKQFGVPIGSFQAVQHALSDMFLKVELFDSLLSFASWALSNAGSQRELASQAALRLVLRDSISLVEKAIQLHGGTGFTWEHDLHLYLRRVRSLCALAGDTAHLDQGFLACAKSRMA